MSLKCWKCGKELGELTKLIGGYNARLCPRCSNAWHEYIHSEYRAYWLDYAILQMRSQLINLTISDIKLVVYQMDKIGSKLYAIAKEWCQSERIPPPAVDQLFSKKE